jgi:nucleoside-diphosphate-sugar epimerase
LAKLLSFIGTSPVSSGVGGPITYQSDITLIDQRQGSSSCEDGVHAEHALSRPGAIGASFHVVAEQAMTQRGLAAGAAGWFGREPVLDFVDWAEFTRRAGPEHAGVTREHTSRSIAASTARAREILGYAPRYSALDALHETLTWLVAHGQADVAGQPFTDAAAGPDPNGR